MPATTSLPVLMYHYINRYPNSIAVSPERFEAHCAELARDGWRGVGLDEAERYFLHGEELPPKSCLITFDDGYLDNYVYAWPILRRYGHKGVVFAVSARIETGETPRPTVQDVWDKTRGEEDLPRVNKPFVLHENGYELRKDLFISWAEARLMEAGGVMRLAAHSFAHRGVFISPEYRGFFLPEHRGRSFHDPEIFCWGLPKFVMGPGLLERAFLPDPELLEKIKALVPQNEKDAFAFAANPENMQALRDLVASRKAGLGRMETEEETAARMRDEIGKGKELLEKELGRPATSLCWPWGAYAALARRLARESGFGVFFTTAPGPNPPGSPLAVHRFKAKDKSPSWLKSRVRLYANPLLAAVYAKLQYTSPFKRRTGRSFVIRQGR
jgi:peptidoglycan/xylan/chitin deacetylase (PgdA/CDA1 family)